MLKILILSLFGISSLAFCVKNRNALLALICLFSLTLCGIGILTITNVNAYVFGGLPIQYGISHASTIFSATIINVIIICSVISLFYKINTGYQYYGVVLSLISASVVTLLSQDIFNLYVFFELASICICVLFAMEKKPWTIEYVITSGISSAFIVIGIGILYAVTGHLNGNAIASAVQTTESLPLSLGVMFIVVAFLIKLGMAPFSKWLKDLYSIGSISILNTYFIPYLALYGIFAFLYIFIASHAVLSFISQNILIPFAILNIILFSTLALFEKTDVRKILAYSSMICYGYLLLALSLQNGFALSSFNLILSSDLISKCGIFLALSEVLKVRNFLHLSDLHGIGKERPILAFVLVVFFISMAGIPLTFGFLGKIYFIIAGLESKSYILLAIFIASSSIQIVYFWRIIAAIYTMRNDNCVEKKTNIADAVLLFLAILIIAFGSCFNSELYRLHNYSTDTISNLNP